MPHLEWNALFPTVTFSGRFYVLIWVTECGFWMNNTWQEFCKFLVQNSQGHLVIWMSFREQRWCEAKKEMRVPITCRKGRKVTVEIFIFRTLDILSWFICFTLGSQLNFKTEVQCHGLSPASLVSVQNLEHTPTYADTHTHNLCRFLRRTSRGFRFKSVLWCSTWICSNVFYLRGWWPKQCNICLPYAQLVFSIVMGCAEGEGLKKIDCCPFLQVAY